MLIRVLGTVGLTDEAADKALGAGQARELLAFLVSRHDDAASTREIVDALWPDDPPATATTIVHGLVRRLRASLGAEVVHRGYAGYRLTAARAEVDLWHLEALLAGRLTNPEHGDDHRLREEIRSLWHRPVFGHYSTRPWARRAIDALGAELKELHHGGGDAQHRGGPLALADLRPGTQRRVPVGRLVGRRRELASVASALRRARLVTVVGLGGVGKTRLAVEAARLTDTPSVMHVDVGAAVGHSSNRLAAELGQVSSGDPAADMRASAALIGQEPRLLVLDACERDPSGSAQLAEYLLGVCSHLAVLATSRRALGVPGEHVVPLLPFADPGDPRSDAVELLLDRVRNMGLAVESTERRAAAAICARAAGVPLAIELGAAELLFGARSDAGSAVAGPVPLSPEAAVAAAVSRAISALTHTTVAAARRVALLVAGFTLEGLEIACQGVGNARAVLQELVASGMVVSETSGANRRLRFLDPVRTGLLELATDDDLSVAAEGLTAHMATVRPRLDEPPVIARLPVAVAALANVDGLLARLAKEGRYEDRLALAVASADAWRDDGRWVAGGHAIEAAIADAPNAPPLVLARARWAQVMVASTFDAARRAVPDLLEAVEVAAAEGDLALEGLLRLHLANGLGYAGDLAAAVDHADRAMAAAEASGSEYLRLGTAVIQPLVLFVSGEFELAHRGFRHIGERLEAIGAPGDAARVRRLGSLALRSGGDLQGALAEAEEAERLAVDGRTRGTLTLIRTEIAELCFEIDPDDSGPALDAALVASLALGDLRAVGIVRMRRGTLRHDAAELATAVGDLLAVDGRWAGAALTHLVKLLPPSSRLARQAPALVAVLAEGWGAPLGALDQAAVDHIVRGVDGPPPDGWLDRLAADLDAIAHGPGIS